LGFYLDDVYQRAIGRTTDSILMRAARSKHKISRERQLGEQSSEPSHGLPWAPSNHENVDPKQAQIQTYELRLVR